MSLFEVVCPEDHVTPPVRRARQKPSLDELAVLSQLQEAERRGTASALDAALRTYSLPRRTTRQRHGREPLEVPAVAGAHGALGLDESPAGDDAQRPSVGAGATRPT